MKMSKVKDYSGETIGYRMGDWYLMKVPTWGNQHEWAINRTGDHFYYKCEDPEGVYFVRTFKEGKQVLMELNEEENFY